jgi:transposase
MNKIAYKSNRNVYYSCKYHIVWCPKYRRKVLVEDVAERLNKSIVDAGWAMFQQFCTYKAANAGREVLLVNPKYTSQVCSSCGTVKKKEPSERWHSCECGTELDRDHNAAINILALGRSVQARA